ncbi:MAG: molybdopterin-dependent oxidoreductase [Syntrophobacteraceae bacterium]
MLPIGSDRNSLETQCMLKRICRSNQWREPAFFTDSATLRKTRSAVERLDGRIAVSMRQIEESDYIIVIGADPLNEAPMTALAIRQAFRKKTQVVIIDPRPVSLPLSFDHIPAAPDDLERFLGIIVRNSIENDPNQFGQNVERFCRSLPEKCEDQALQERIDSFSAGLRACRRPVIICGTGIVRESTPAFAADCALLLRHENKEAGIFYILPGAGSFSSGLLSGPEGQAFSDIIEEIEKGAVRALIAVENDPFRYSPDRKRLDEALSKLELLVVIDYLPTEMVKRASIFYPASTIFETDSTYVNQEGRAQFARRVHSGGIPVWGGQPPHIFRDFVPGGDHLPAWDVLREIGCVPRSPEQNAMAVSPGEFIAEHPFLEGLSGGNYPADGIRIIPAKSGSEFSGPGTTERKPEELERLELLLVEWLYSTGELAAWSDTMSGSMAEPAMYMHVTDAGRAGISNGDTVSLELENGVVQVKAALFERMAEGVLILPRHPSLDWGRIGALPAWVELSKIKKG